MPSLCLDTATASPVVALVGADGELLRGAVVDGRAQAVLGVLDELLDGTDRSAIDAVFVGTGPGTFTGLRVGVTTARGIAEALGVPLYGMSSLLAVAADQLEPGERAWATIAGGRGELFAQAFEADASGAVSSDGGSQVVKLDAIDELVGSDRRIAAMVPSPSSLAAAVRRTRARVSAADAAAGDPLGVVPSYGRAPDADPPRMQLRYDALTADDLDALVVLEQRCFDNPWTREMYASELERPAADGVHLAARDTGANDRLVGAALAARLGDSWHVMNVLVDPIARGRGIGARLMVDLLARTEELGVEEGWTLEVRDGNGSAIRLYERHGFQHAGVRPGYYQDTGDDAIVMWRYAGDRAEATP